MAAFPFILLTMDANTRKSQILDEISIASVPVSAAALAGRFGVSRQVIVSDVALLRALGHEITATSRGYVLASKLQDKNQYFGKIVSRHAAADAAAELYAIVDMGGTVVNVIIEHDLYGEITGGLNLKTRDDVDLFISRLNSSRDKLLLELSHHGVHLHTIACRDKSHFDDIVRVLKAKKLLFQIEKDD